MCWTLFSVAKFSRSSRLLIVSSLSPLSISTYLQVCGCSRGSFVRAFEEMLRSHIEPNSGRVTQNFPPIKRLSLHGCQTLPAHVYPLLLALLPDLTHLVRLSYMTENPTDHSRI